MNAATRSSFVYVTFIRTTPEKLWEALTEPRVIRQYWFDAIVECGWKEGSPWNMARPDGSLTDTGRIQEIDPPRRMVIHWQNEWEPGFKAEGPSLCSMTLEPVDRAVKLTVTHEIERPESRFIAAVSPPRALTADRNISSGQPLRDPGQPPAVFHLLRAGQLHLRPVPPGRPHANPRPYWTRVHLG